MTSGIYQIRHMTSGKVYVGSSGNIPVRWRLHKRELQKSAHHSSKLQRAWNKYGADAFVFEVLEECPIPSLRSREQHWMDTLHAFTSGYNCTAKALEHSEEVRARLARKAQGRTASMETRRKMSDAHLGVKVKVEHLHTPGARAKAAEAKRGVPLDARRAEILRDPTVQAKAAASRTGKSRGPYKPSGQPDGRNKPMSEEQKAKMRGRVVSEESRRRMSEAAQRRAATPEGRARLQANGVTTARKLTTLEPTCEEN